MEVFRNNDAMPTTVCKQVIFLEVVAPAPRIRLVYNDFGGGPSWSPCLSPRSTHGQKKTFFLFSEEVRRVVQSFAGDGVVAQPAGARQDPSTGNQTGRC